MFSTEQGRTQHSEADASVGLGKLVSGAMISGEEIAPTPKPNLYLAIGNAARDHLGDVVPNENQRAEIVRALSVFEGIIPASEYSKADVADGVARAKRLVSSNQSSDFLSRLKMVTQANQLPKYNQPLHIDMNGELAIDPRRIVGVGSLVNWQGIAYSDGKIIEKHEEGSTSFRSRPSYEVIDDYATRETQLPPAKYVELFLTPAGAFAYSHDSHRVAAAQLRHEPVRINDVYLFDYRSRSVSETERYQLEDGLRIAESNNAIESV